MAVYTSITDSNIFYQNLNTGVLFPERDVVTDSIFYSNQNVQKNTLTLVRTINNGKDTVQYGLRPVYFTYTNYLNPFKDLMGYNLMNTQAIPNKNLIATESLTYPPDKDTFCNTITNYSYAFDSLGRLINMVSNFIPNQRCNCNNTPTTITTRYYY